MQHLAYRRWILRSVEKHLEKECNTSGSMNILCLKAKCNGKKENKISEFGSVDWFKICQCFSLIIGCRYDYG